MNLKDRVIAQFLSLAAARGRLLHGSTVYLDAGAREAVSPSVADGAGTPLQCQQLLLQQQPEAGAEAPAPATAAITPMEMTANDEQPASAALRVAAAAAPHKRQAVAAVAAVETGGGGGKRPPEADEAGGGGPAAAGEADGYRLVVHRRHGARGPRTAKAAADRAPVGRLRVQKGGNREAGGGPPVRGGAGGGRGRVPGLRGVRGAGVGRAALRGGRAQLCECGGVKRRCEERGGETAGRGREEGRGKHRALMPSG